MDNEPEVYYIDNRPGAANYYNPVTEAIILDEKLKEYPLAHSHILSHEFGHHEHRDNFLDNLWYELKHDIELAFSQKPAIQEVREYDQATEISWEEKKILLAGRLQNLLRMHWCLLIYPAGKAYRYLKQRSRGIQKNAEGGS
ncbi:hypothetical protein HT576_08845 [Haloterrigena sp. SYSU A121-1]|uniref:Uncharacterized protein n=1 Tax=Haloterrigena gelatinilytica TaxID=2741724 RepID=A0A8J8GNL8_9EURY|nr:hypothetical protein [Haloterrigena gelatinilytica]NUB91127.1 hypothetical protein [Haloterrigena gelatinilytica]